MMIATTTPITIPAIAPPLMPEPESESESESSPGDALADGEGVVVAQEYEPWKTAPLLSPPSAFCLSMPLHPAEPVAMIEDSPFTRSRFSKERLYDFISHRHNARRLKGKRKHTY